MRNLKAITAKEFLLLDRERAVSNYVLRQWHLRQRRKESESVTVRVLAKSASNAVSWIVVSAISVSAAAASAYFFQIPMLWLAVGFFAVLALVAALNWSVEADRYNIRFGEWYGQLLIYLAIRSGELAALSDGDIDALVDRKLRQQAEILVAVEQEVKRRPHVQEVTDRKTQEHAIMTQMFDCCDAMGLVPVPESGWTPYFEGLQPTRSSKQGTDVPQTVAATA